MNAEVGNAQMPTVYEIAWLLIRLDFGVSVIPVAGAC